MPRITLYVPDNLKVKMDQANGDINWSAIAQRAITDAVPASIERKPRPPLITNSVCAEEGNGRRSVLLHPSNSRASLVKRSDITKLRDWLTLWLNETGDKT